MGVKGVEREEKIAAQVQATGKKLLRFTKQYEYDIDIVNFQSI